MLHVLVIHRCISTYLIAILLRDCRRERHVSAPAALTLVMWRLECARHDHHKPHVLQYTILGPHCLPPQTEVHESPEVREHLPLPLSPVSRWRLRSRRGSVRLRRTKRREDAVLPTQCHATAPRACESRSLRCERWIQMGEGSSARPGRHRNSECAMGNETSHTS